MRKLTAMAVALGFLAATGLPTIAAPTVNNGVITLSAQSKDADTAMKKPVKKEVTKKPAEQKDKM